MQEFDVDPEGCTPAHRNHHGWKRALGSAATPAPVEGHRRGEHSVREMVESCGNLGVRHLTLYTFSAENWRRSREEVGALMRLIEFAARKEIAELHRKNVRLRVLGRLHELPVSLQEELERDVRLTRDNTGLNLNLAINYGGRAEIVDAARRLAERVRTGQFDPADINEETFARELYCPEMPDPDLLIRTGGEMRLSNYLLWQIAYSELWITQTLWPDFRTPELLEAIRAFQSQSAGLGPCWFSAVYRRLTFNR